MKRYWSSLKNRFFLKSNTGSLKVGLVGVGGWGMVNAVSLMKSRRFTIQGVYDLNQISAQQFARRYKVPVYDSYESLLANSSIEGVILTVPNPVHEEMISKAAAADKHIFVEKPLASSPEVCERLVALCSGKKLTLMVGHQVRREPAFRAMKRIIDGGTLGDPVKARGIRTINKIAKDWRDDPLACPGGSMEQLGIHLIDAMIFLFGKPISFSGWNKNIPRKTSGDEWGHIEISFDGGVSGVVESSYSSKNRLEFEIVFSDGVLLFDGKRLSLHGENQKKQITVNGPEGSVEQFDEFANCLELGHSPETDGAQAQLVMEVIQAIHGTNSSPLD